MNMKIGLSDTFGDVCKKLDADIHKITNKAFTDASQFIKMPDSLVINFNISHPLSNWVRPETILDGKELSIYFDISNLDATDLGLIYRDLVATHIIAHEISHGVIAVVPFTETFYHDFLGQKFYLGELSKESVAHTSQLTCADVYVDKTLVGLHTQAMGFILAHCANYRLDNLRLIELENSTKSGKSIFDSTSPYEIADIFLTIGRRASVAGEIRKTVAFKKEGKWALSENRQFRRMAGKMREQFFNLLSSVLNDEELYDIQMQVYNELSYKKPKWRTLLEILENINGF